MKSFKVNMLSIFAVSMLYAAPIQANNSLMLSEKKIAAIPTSPPKEDPTQKAMKARIFQDALVKVYFEKPRLYEAHKKAIEGPEYALEAKKDLFYKQLVVNGIRMIPSDGVAGSVKERISIGNEQWDSAYDIEHRREMRADPQAVLKIAKKAQEFMYDQNEEGFFKDFYEDSKQYDGDNKLPDPFSYQALKLEYPEIADRYNNSNLTDKQKQDLCDGRMNKRQFMEATKMDEDAYKSYVTKAYNLELPDPTTLPSSLASNVDLGRTQDQINRQRDADLTALQKRVSQSQTNLYAGTAVLALFDPEAADKVAKLGGAAIDIYGSIGSMVLNNAIDPTGIGTVASAAGIVMGMFGSGPSPDQIITDLLKDVLENQKKILARLDEIENKVDRVQESVSYLIRITDYNYNKVHAELTNINHNIGKIKGDFIESQNFQRLLSQEETTRKFQNDKESLIRPFHNRIGSKDWKSLNSAIENPKNTNPMAEDHFKKVRELLNRMYVFGTVQLDDDQSATFTDASNIATIDIETINKKAHTDINQLVGMLPNIGSWLGLHVGQENPLVNYEDKDVTDYPDGSALKIKVGNPGIFSLILKEYIKLAMYRPIEKNASGKIIPDDNMIDFCADFTKTEEAINQMRLHVPLAQAVLSWHLDRFYNIYKQHVSTEASALNISEASETKPASTADVANPKVLFSGLSDVEMAANLRSLDDHAFAEFGTKYGILDRKYFIAKFPAEPNFYSVTTIECTRGLQNTHNLANFRYAYRIIKHSPMDVYNTTIPDVNSEEYKKSEAWYKNVRFDDKEVLTQLSSDSTTRMVLENVFIDEIQRRQTKLSESWATILNDEPEYLTTLYRAKFVLETLVKGGYGPFYRNVKELAGIKQSIDDANKICDLVETKWRKGQEVLGKNIVEDVDATQTISDPMTADTNIAATPPKSPDASASALIHTYLKTYSKFEEKTTDTDSTKYRQVQILSAKMPVVNKNPMAVDIGKLDEAREALRIAAQYLDMAPPSNCFKQPKPL